MVRAAQVVSVIFHPLLLTTYLVAILGLWIPSLLLIKQEHLGTFVIFVFGITFILPALNLYLFRQYGMISSLEMKSRQERVTPFVFIAIVYLLIAALFAFRVHVSINFTRLLEIVAALVAASAIATFFFKVSVHSLAWWGIVGMVLPLNVASGGRLLWPMVAVILIAGVVMSARLKLNAHTLDEVLIGGLLGFAVSFTGMGILF